MYVCMYVYIYIILAQVLPTCAKFCVDAISGISRMHSFGTRACVCEILCGQHLRNFENNYYGCRFAMRDHTYGSGEALPTRI